MFPGSFLWSIVFILVLLLIFNTFKSEKQEKKTKKNKNIKDELSMQNSSSKTSEIDSRPAFMESMYACLYLARLYDIHKTHDEYQGQEYLFNLTQYLFQNNNMYDKYIDNIRPGFIDDNKKFKIFLLYEYECVKNYEKDVPEYDPFNLRQRYKDLYPTSNEIEYFTKELKIKYDQDLSQATNFGLYLFRLKQTGILIESIKK